MLLGMEAALYLGAARIRVVQPVGIYSVFHRPVMERLK